MTMREAIMWWGAVLLITLAMTNYGISQFDQSPTVHQPVSEEGR